jgi:glycosyltransferase involved in cell wall biosynthesis
MDGRSSTMGLIRREKTIWKIFAKAYEDASAKSAVDMVILPYIDDCLNEIGLKGSPFGKTPWTGITMRPMFHFSRLGVVAPKPRLSAIRGWMFRGGLRRGGLAGLFTIDTTLDEYAGKYLHERERKKLHYLPDPAVDHVLETKAEARRTLGIPADARVILGYGMIAEGKGHRALLEAVNDADCPAGVCVVLAGMESPDNASIVGSEPALTLIRQNRLKVINKYVSDAEEALLLAAADCMWIGYKGFYLMSAVYVLAARHGIPCIVSYYGVAGYLMKKYRFGLTVDPEDKRSILAVLREVSEDNGALAEMGKRGKEAFKEHSVAEFQKRIGEVIERTIGGGDSDGRKQNRSAD